jgi:VWFA-related protein
MSVARIFAGTVLVIAAASHAAAQAPPQRPVFRSSVELLAVDVSVLDKDGRPVGGLGPADFEVQVGGRPREVIRAELIDFTDRAAAFPDLLEVTSNQVETAVVEPRLVLLLIDDESFAASEGRTVFMRLAALVERMFPRDPMAFATLSGVGRSVEFTTERKAIAEALRSTVGRRATRPLAVTLGIAEAFEIVRSGNRFAAEKAYERECAGEEARMRDACEHLVESEAASLVTDVEQTAHQTATSLSRHFSAMAALPGTKYVLLVSQGMVLGDEATVRSDIARAAAASGVTVHALFVDRAALPDVSERQPSPTGFEDARMRSSGLETIAGSARGTVHRTLGDPSNAFERIRREMSAVYRLGIQVEPGDEGPRPIEVKVRRDGVTTRAHRQVVTPTGEAPLTHGQRLTRTLQSPLVDRSIPMRLATFGFRGPDGKTQLVVSAEADASPKGLRAAYALRDQHGLAIGASELGLESVIAEKDAPPLIVFTTRVPAGEYTLKIAVVDEEGRTGSVSRPVTLRAPSGELELGDVIVLPDGAELSRVRPSSRVAVRSRRASVYFELYAGRHSQPKAVPVVLEIADAPDGPALVSARTNVPLKGSVPDTYASGRIGFSPAALPPGRYFARLSIEGSDKRALRGFTVTAGTAALASSALLPDEARAVLPRFRVAQFLSAPLLQAVSKRLATYGDGNLAVQDAMRALEDGTWGDITVATGDPVTDATVRGLQALVTGQPAEAEQAFREALEADPEFTLALALAGGAWASVGRDREATRSWRTSLATGVEAPFLYGEVMTALLRVGDVRGAREFLEEISLLEEPGAVEALGRERALAPAIAGDRAAAVTALGSWVDAHPEDAEAAFLLVLALYEMKTIERNASVAAQFEARAKQYLTQNGPRSALVERWLR